MDPIAHLETKPSPSNGYFGRDVVTEDEKAQFTGLDWQSTISRRHTKIFTDGESYLPR